MLTIINSSLLRVTEEDRDTARGVRVKDSHRPEDSSTTSGHDAALVGGELLEHLSEVHQAGSYYHHHQDLWDKTCGTDGLHLGLTIPEVLLAVFPEDRRHGLLLMRELHHGVDVKALVLECVGKHLGDGALATAHHANEVQAAALKIGIQLAHQLGDLCAEQVKIKLQFKLALS